MKNIEMFLNLIKWLLSNGTFKDYLEQNLPFRAAFHFLHFLASYAWISAAH